MVNVDCVVNATFDAELTACILHTDISETYYCIDVVLNTHRTKRI
jgi:hypothetical protein